ncbi:hypothetical protein nbrc107696_28720 [Gordonia spumicola]|uniref:Uncharacterized protein n=1 Tax=Gordonia spumicola TaxID=589161 RepID=A0A7I9VAM2_9ACTN|nr:hypothetical protein nbrc107696_28720 [Gordonia spumicola]
MTTRRAPADAVGTAHQSLHASDTRGDRASVPMDYEEKRSSTVTSRAHSSDKAGGNGDVLVKRPRDERMSVAEGTIALFGGAGNAHPGLVKDVGDRVEMISAYPAAAADTSGRSESPGS